jgi:hypothetical protein
VPEVLRLELVPDTGVRHESGGSLDAIRPNSANCGISGAPAAKLQKFWIFRVASGWYQNSWKPTTIDTLVLIRVL